MQDENNQHTKRKTSAPERVVKTIQNRRKHLEIRRNAWALTGKIVTITLCGYLVCTFLFGIGAVRGEGMYPRMRDGDMVIFYRMEAEQNVSDIVAYSKNGALFYGRIVALGGDTVDFNEDGQLLVNGSVQQEEVFSATSAEGRATVFPIQLTQDEVFVLGDNREYAQDSRDFGPISKGDIRGKVISLDRKSVV